METLIDNSVSILRGAAEDKGLNFKVSLDPAMAAFYVGDEMRLRQILLNLLNNAIKFTESGFVRLDVARR